MARKSGIHRTRFTIESVTDLRANLQKVGSGLLVAQAEPELFLPKLVNQEMNTTVVFTAETCSEERSVEDALRQALEQLGTDVQLIPLDRHSLISLEDYKGVLDEQDTFPRSFSAFKKLTAHQPIA